jgi:hypothetical protein
MVRPLWIYRQIGLRVFPCYRVSLLVARFCWRTSDGSARICRAGGQMWRNDTVRYGRVERIAEIDYI